MTEEHEVVEHARANQHRNVRYNVAMLVVVLVTCLALVVGGIILYVKVDGKVSHIETVQHMNTVRDECQNTAFDHILGDIVLLVKGDKDPSDYARVVQCQ